MAAIPEIAPEDNLEQDAATIDPVLAEYQNEEQQAHWQKELDAAREERRKWDTAGVETIKRYADIREEKDLSMRFNLFHSNTDIKMAALFSRSPMPDIRRRFLDASDDASRVASTLLQRCIAIELDATNFEQKFNEILFDYLVPGMGIGWVRFEEDTDEAGNVVEQNVVIDRVSWDDFYWSPCQSWLDCRWVARRIPMSRKALEARFGSTTPPDVLADISYEVKKEGQREKAPTDGLKPKNVILQTADVYEIWDKENRIICWFHEGSTVPLDVKPDTDERPDFFPTPLPPLGNFTTASTIPRSDWSQVQTLYAQLDTLLERLTGYISAAKVRFAYDASFRELADLFKTDEFSGVPLDKMSQFLAEKGGFAGVMQFVPIQDFITARSATLQDITVVQQQIFEIEGIADFMRGETQRYDSAAAINQKGSFAATRFGARQKKVALYVERLIRQMAHLISKFYKPEVLVDHAGALSPADQQFLAPAVQLIQSNFHSNFRLSVSVDSLQDAQWNVEKAERTAVVRTIGDMIAGAGPMVQSRPELGPLFVELMRFALAGYKGSAPIEGVLDAALQQLLQSASQSQGQPQQPSKEEIKAAAQARSDQVKLQIVNEQEQTKRMVAAQEAQSRQVNDQLEMQEARVRTAAQVAETQMEAITQSAKIAIEQQKLNLARAKQ